MRLILASSIVTTAYVVNLYYLNETWYKPHLKTSFHFYNDNNEWLQMDKMGHLWTSYQEGVMGIKLLTWCGVKQCHAETFGSFLGIILQTPIEILDGTSAFWGFSWGDMGANLTGSLVALVQAKLWHEQRVSIKFSSHRESYNDSLGVSNIMYGTNFFNRTLKDYNGQTYWISVNLKSFFRNMKYLPPWLNVAFGYGVSAFDFYEAENRYREYYFSLDVDFTKIPVKSKVLRTVFVALNCLKMPFPALEYNQKDKWKMHPFYF